MDLKFPLGHHKVMWNKKIFPTIPLKSLNPSGYDLIAEVHSTFDVYVAFTNEEKSEVWIEKKHKLQNPGRIFMDDLVKIEDDEEFNKIHSFLIKQGLLDKTNGKERS